MKTLSSGAPRLGLPHPASPAQLSGGQGTPTSALPQTTLIERGLLILIIACLPLQDHIPNIGGFSVNYFFFFAALLYLIANRLSCLVRVVLQPVFLSMLAFLAVASVMEMLHAHTDLYEVRRIAEMTAGGIIVAGLCRDREAMTWALRGCILAGAYLSTLVFLHSYGMLSDSAVAGFQEASALREEVFSEAPLNVDLNDMAYYSAGAGAMALAFALFSTTRWVALTYTAACAFCLLCAFLPLSRSGAIMAVATSCAVLLSSKKLWRRGTAFIVVLLVAGVVLVTVPGAVFSRMVFGAVEQGGNAEGRTLVYRAVVDNASEYLLVGVGWGHYWSNWGILHGFGRVDQAMGPHNSLFAVAIYWGLPGLMALSLVMWQAARCVPRIRGDDRLAACLLSLAVSLLVFMLFNHALYSKRFSLGLGILAAGRAWVWLDRSGGANGPGACWARRRRDPPDKTRTLPRHRHAERASGRAVLGLERVRSRLAASARRGLA